jgi:hypothetical protein
MTLASHSTTPLCVKLDPFPAFVRGSSSKTLIAALTASRGQSFDANDSAAVLHAFFITVNGRKQNSSVQFVLAAERRRDDHSLSRSNSNSHRLYPSSFAGE